MRLIDADKYIEEMSEGTFLGEISIKEFNEMFLTIEAYTKEEVMDMLSDIQLEIMEIVNEEYKHDAKWTLGLKYSTRIIQQKIDDLKAESEDKE